MAKGYSNDEITVYFDNDTCMHSGNCVNGLKSVFNPKGRLWINMQGASSEEIIKAVKNCPSGALTHKMNSELSESKDSQVQEVSIKVNKGGPLLIKGKVKLIENDGTETIKEGPFILCRCGYSKTKPFCDNSHRDKKFDE
jgi:uncharacterized Fe-S cluster protein YjdI